MQQTNQTSNGSKIKALINSETDHFPWVKDPGQKAKLNHLVAVIDKYRELAFIRKYPSEGLEDMTELVYVLLGQSDWESCIVDFRFESRSLMRKLATPTISKAIQEAGYNVDRLIRLTSALITFFETLELHPYQSMLLSHDLKSLGTDYKDDAIDQLTEEYEARLAAAAEGKISFYY